LATGYVKWAKAMLDYFRGGETADPVKYGETETNLKTYKESEVYWGGLVNTKLLNVRTELDDAISIYEARLNKAKAVLGSLEKDQVADIKRAEGEVLMHTLPFIELTFLGRSFPDLGLAMEDPSTIRTLYLIGPSSTGKSTLFRAMGEDMGLDPGQCVTEVARTVMKRTGFSRKTVGDIEMQRMILAAQLEQEQVARCVAGTSATRMVLSDRSAIDPITYAVLTALDEGEARERMRELVGTTEFQAALGRYRDGSFILFKPVPEWLVDDGVRSMDDQEQSVEVFRDVLQQLGIPYVELGEEVKDLQARVAFAKRLISQVG